MKEIIKKKARKNNKIYLFLNLIYIILKSYISYFTRQELYPRRIVYFHKKKVIYFPIYKVANSSIFNALGRENGIIKNKLKTEYENYYKITFIRNPFDRIVSCYNDKYSSKRKRFHFSLFNYVLWPFNSIKFNQKDSFEDFIKKIIKFPNYMSDGHFKSQYSFLYEKNICLVDFVGKYENLTKDWNYFSNKYKISKLPHYNQNKKANWKDYYTIELAKLVYSKYKKDFDLWYPDEYNKLIRYLQTKLK